MFRVRDEMATSQAEHQDPAGGGWKKPQSGDPSQPGPRISSQRKEKFKRSRNWGKVGETGENSCSPRQSVKTGHLLLYEARVDSLEAETFY
jgi:hypothetical protein